MRRVRGLKTRLQAAGALISVIGLGLLALRGFHPAYGAVFALGLVLLVTGLVWK